MTNNSDTRTQEAFETLKKSVKLYGAVCAITLGTVAVVTVSSQSANTFMWVRAILLLAIAPFLYRMTVRAEQGSRRSFERVRTLTVIMPIAIIAVDLIPGACPTWYAAMQGISALALVGAAFLMRGPVLSSAFPKSS